MAQANPIEIQKHLKGVDYKDRCFCKPLQQVTF